MNICLLVFRVDSLTYTLARALTQGNHRVFVQSEAADIGDESYQGLRHALSGDPLLTFLGPEAPPPGQFDRLIVQGYAALIDASPALPILAPRASRITLISIGDRYRTLRKALQLQRRELRWLRPWRRKIDRVLYKDGYYPMDLYRFRWPRASVGFDVHSQFLEDPEAYRQIHAADWEAGTRRPILANFLGSRDPRPRKILLDKVRPLMFPEGENESQARVGKTWFWHEYSDAAPGGLQRREFVDILTTSDFTLCPLGYSLLTHRPMEALLRGSIPVLDTHELDLYTIDLQDMKNCIAAPGGDWTGTIERLLSLDEERIAEMREYIGSMRDSLLDYPVWSAQMRARLGVD